ncbi:MAG: hypothetical protein AAGA48_29995 [Myxococcota bacterium]
MSSKERPLKEIAKLLSDAFPEMEKLKHFVSEHFRKLLPELEQSRTPRNYATNLVQMLNDRSPSHDHRDFRTLLENLKDEKSRFEDDVNRLLDKMDASLDSTSNPWRHLGTDEAPVFCLATSGTTIQNKYTRKATGTAQVKALATCLKSMLQYPDGPKFDTEQVLLAEDVSTDLQKKNLIIIGGRKTNILAAKSLDALNHGLDMADPADPSLSRLDIQLYPWGGSFTSSIIVGPGDGTQLKPDRTDEKSPEIISDYGLVVRMPNPWSNQTNSTTIVLLCGCHEFATNSAAKWYVDQALKQPQYFAAVFKCDVLEGQKTWNIAKDTDLPGPFDIGSITPKLHKRLNGRVVVVEEKACSAKGVDNQGDDLVVPPLREDGIGGVIEGMTPLESELEWGSVTAGRFAAETVANAVRGLPPDVGKEDALERLTDALREEYNRKGRYTQLSTDASARPSCGVALYSPKKRQVWLLGNCQCLIMYPAGVSEWRSRIRKLDRVYADARSILLLSSEEKGARRWDEGIRQISKLQHRFRNAKEGNRFCFGAIDGFRVHQPNNWERVDVRDDATAVILATDGYPVLCETLEDSERQLFNILHKDPQMVGKYPRTKGRQTVAEGSSFDDRAYLKLSLCRTDK